MIIDCHGHYTTAPKALETWRNQQIAGIHYTTLVAMVEGTGVENNGYSMLEIMPDSSLRLQGFRKQVERRLT